MIKTDICVIGGGAAGLSVAAGSALLGSPTILIEQDRPGGDCLNTGCIPSKTLLAVAKMFHDHDRAGPFSQSFSNPAFSSPTVDFEAVGAHLRAVIAAIAPSDSIARYQALGVTVITGTARFIDPHHVAVGDEIITARRFVIATGTRTAIPAIPGLDQVAYLTHRSIFALTTQPGHLIIIGAGPTGVEIALAYRRLGSAVSLIDRGPILRDVDPEFAALITTRLRAEGVALFPHCAITHIRERDGGVILTLEHGDHTGSRTGPHASDLAGSHLFLATGRRPNIEDLDLGAARIRADARGIRVNPSLLTDNTRVFAAGDVAGGPAFTHVAGYHATIILRQALFRLPAKVDHGMIPTILYTDPELAEIGLKEDAARQKHRHIRILRFPVGENDRARCDGTMDGLIKVITTRRGRILGVAILAPHAGDLIQVWQLAMTQGLSIGAMAQLIVPYPTIGEISKRAAGSFYAARLFSDRTKAIVRFLRRFG